MTDIPDEWVEKAAEAIFNTPIPPEIVDMVRAKARAVLAAVADDIGAAERKRIEAEDEAITEALGQLDESALSDDAQDMLRIVRANADLVRENERLRFALTERKVAPMPEVYGAQSAETPRCPRCGHAPHDSLGFCPNMASDNDCACVSEGARAEEVGK